MSTEIAEVSEESAVALNTKEPSEPLLSKRRRRIVSDPLNEDNPITVQVLGICSALAVTVQFKPTMIMSIAVIFVIVFSNLITSVMRKIIPNRIRIIVQLAIIATLVTLVSEVLKAYSYDMYKILGAYVGLIITNCIVMGRLEAFAMANKPYDSILDGFGSGFGYAWIILVVAFFRELLGGGTVFVGTPLEFDVYGSLGSLFGTTLQTNGLMVDSIGAFILLGMIIWIQRSKNGYVEH
ncbi:NADH:ubiquinone reductase (Na(+)-transporting) subunit D [Ekhidna sp.]|uniref:NADH:ubiquinone reductase (Na(+)-transporting) subunit D n=1 Tax=Ekhidna sp. TaxID=2608089 RepID=UPI003296ADF3